MHADNFASRIEMLVEKIGGVGKACKAANITYTTLTRWKDGTSDPKISNLKALADAGGVSVDWLIAGEKGENINRSLQEKRGEYYVTSSSTLEPKASKEEEYVYIPVYDIEVSAGYGAFTEGATKPRRQFAFRKRWIQARGLDASKLSAVFAKGDSMEPTIKDGAVLVIDHKRNLAMDGKIYVIKIGNRLWVKRTQWLFDGGLRLISDNNIYQPIDVPKIDLEQENNVEVLGQVIHTSYDLE